MRNKRNEYHELLREEQKVKQEQKLQKEWTFKPKINSTSECRFYFYQSASSEGTIYNKADVIKRNELWTQSKQKRLEILKKEQDSQIKEDCTFAPKTSYGKLC